ncbi:MAG: hypothetical protein ACUVT9_05440 [Candidatus Bathycorpusculaceae bacterium]
MSAFGVKYPKAKKNYRCDFPLCMNAIEKGEVYVMYRSRKIVWRIHAKHFIEDAVNPFEHMIRCELINLKKLRDRDV